MDVFTFIERLHGVMKRLEALTEKDEQSSSPFAHGDDNYCRQVDDALATIGELQLVVRQAEECLELYDQVSDWGDADSEVRLTCKESAWNHLEMALDFLGTAYYRAGDFESALPIFRQLVDHVIRMRKEVEGVSKKSAIPLSMEVLARCYYNTEQYELAREWFQKALHFCKLEKSDSELENTLREVLATSFADMKAGPVLVDAADAASSNNKKLWKRCWGCGAAESAKTKLNRCSKCFDLKLPTPAYYCNVACQERDWDRHKAYHKELKAHKKKISQDFSTSGRGRGGGRRKQPVGEYNRLQRESESALAEGDLQKARRLMEKTIKLQPRNPQAYNNLAALYYRCKYFDGFVEALLAIMRIADEDGDKEKDWSNAAAHLFAFFYDDDGSCLNKKPTWLSNPKEQLAVAERVCNCLPNRVSGLVMRADAYEKLEDFDMAIEHFSIAQRVAEANADTEGVERIRDHVRKLKSH